MEVIWIVTTISSLLRGGETKTINEIVPFNKYGYGKDPESGKLREGILKSFLDKKKVMCMTTLIRNPSTIFQFSKTLWLILHYEPDKK
jgi:hypothetical protein